jgi:adenosylmethionine---8-amino-7-oxononanoate aminotransferase
MGRRVCAHAVARGVLLRPLGDVVVVVPPLTTTVDEIEHVVAVLAASLDAVWREDHEPAGSLAPASSMVVR